MASAVRILTDEEQNRRQQAVQAVQDVNQAQQQQTFLNLEGDFEGDAVSRFLEGQGESYRLFVDLLDPIREQFGRARAGDEGALRNVNIVDQLLGAGTSQAAFEGGNEGLLQVANALINASPEALAQLPAAGVSITDVVESRPVLEQFVSLGGSTGLVDFYGEQNLVPSTGQAAAAARRNALEQSREQAARDRADRIAGGAQEPGGAVIEDIYANVPGTRSAARLAEQAGYRTPQDIRELPGAQVVYPTESGQPIRVVIGSTEVDARLEDDIDAGRVVP